MLLIIFTLPNIRYRAQQQSEHIAFEIFTVNTNSGSNVSIPLLSSKARQEKSLPV